MVYAQQYSKMTFKTWSRDTEYTHIFMGMHA